MWNLETLGDRIKYIQNKLGGSTNLEKLSGVSAPQQSRLIRNEIKSPGLTQIAAIAKAGGVTLDWIATGEGDVDGSQNASGFVALPFIEDNGQAPMMFERHYLVNILGVKVPDARMYKQSGDAMAPMIKDGDHVLVNLSRKDGNGIFLVRIDGNMYLQRLQYLPGAGVDIISDNNSYKSYTLQPEQVEVIGQLAWIGSR